MWHVAGPSEYLVITGLGIKDIKLAKKAWVLVGQKWGLINVRPVPYEYRINARTSDFLEFSLPANYTIGPDPENKDDLRRYARLVAPTDVDITDRVNIAVHAIVEGQTRAVAANLTMEEIFKGAEEFHQRVKQLVQQEIAPFGLKVYTANVPQLLDEENRPYFSFMGMKAQKEAENKAKMDVAEARYVGDTGAKVREGRREREIENIDAETAKYKAEKAAEVERRRAEVEAETGVMVSEKKIMKAMAEKEVKLTRAKLQQETAIAEVEAKRAEERRDADLRRDVERQRGLADTERARATVVGKALVDREASQEAARAEQYKKEREAEAALFKRKADAEAREAAAEAAAFARKQAAEARIREGEAEAEVRRQKARAIADSVRTVGWAVFHMILAICLSYYLIGLVEVGRRSLQDSTVHPPLNVITPKAIFTFLLTGGGAPSSLPSSASSSPLSLDTSPPSTENVGQPASHAPSSKAAPLHPSSSEEIPIQNSNMSHDKEEAT